MIRLGTLLWLALVVVSGYAMFQVKYEVAQLDDELTRVNREVAKHRKAIGVLGAEWSFLDQSARLAPLAQRYLTLGPIGPAQIGRLDSLPRRADAPASPATSAPPPPAVPAAGARFANAKPGADR